MKPPPITLAPVRRLGPRRIVVQQTRTRDSTILGGWVIIFLGLAIACIPGLGFSMYFLSIPVSAAAFILGIIAASRGRTLGGIFLIFSSFAAFGLFLLIPWISVGIAAAISP